MNWSKTGLVNPDFGSYPPSGSCEAQKGTDFGAYPPNSYFDRLNNLVIFDYLPCIKF